MLYRKSELARKRRTAYIFNPPAKQKKIHIVFAQRLWSGSNVERKDRNGIMTFFGKQREQNVSWEKRIDKKGQRQQYTSCHKPKYRHKYLLACVAGTYQKTKMMLCALCNTRLV